MTHALPAPPPGEIVPGGTSGSCTGVPSPSGWRWASRSASPGRWFSGLLRGAEAGIAFGLAGGVVFTLTFGFTGASAIYLVAVVMLRGRGRIPLRLMSLLEDAHRVGLLRQLGPVYRFRHEKLQDRLAHLHAHDDRP
ncbi:hypothetical protein [Microtetraspora malaysiensis]|uniref:hypothetical protein n=1 Tax=Microtetraspora malaysiensis TaxID=161358 RepID=UPI003D8AEC89